VGFFTVEKNVLFDQFQMGLFSFIGKLVQSKGIAISIEKFFGVWAHFYCYNQLSNKYDVQNAISDLIHSFGVDNIYERDYVHTLLNNYVNNELKWIKYNKKFAYQPVSIQINSQYEITQ
jgi:hypothetical protein